MSTLRMPEYRVAAVLAAAATLAAVLIGASRLSHDDASSPTPVPASADTGEASVFAGIEQHGTALGSPDAPLTLVEYADLQCPYCAQWSRETLPTLVADYVATGKLRIVFRGLAFIGQDSDEALRTAVAAGRENHLWDVVHGLYLRQGAENAGWVTDPLVRALADESGLDGAALLDARWESSIAPELDRAAAAARAAGVNSTPAFQLGPTGGKLELLRVDSLGPEGIVPAIEAALAR